MFIFDTEQHTAECVEWIRKWFEFSSGGARGAVVGISGGKDSSVVAALLVKALGAERVMGVMMPNGRQSDINDSKKLCSRLGIPNTTVNIETAYAELTANLGKAGFMPSPHTATNVPPRLRMTVLYAVAQELNYRVAGTGNLSERYVGYSTKWGDTACDFNPIACFTSDEVIEIGEYLGLPKLLTRKPPADGLTGRTDEENLGFTYEALNRYIRKGLCEDMELKFKIDRIHATNAHKSQRIPVYAPLEVPPEEEIMEGDDPVR